jgi:hypothetical protein
VVEGLVIALLVILVAGLLRSHAEILRALRDLGVELEPTSHHSPTPPVPTRLTTTDRATDLQGITPGGRTRSVGVVGVEHTTMLAFLSSGCLTCAAFWDAFSQAEQLTLPGHDTRLVIVTKGAEAESPATIEAKAPRQFITVMSSQARDDYGVPITPYFVLVDGPSGRIAGEGAAATWHQLESLLAQAAADGGVLRDHRLTRGDTQERRRASEDTLAAHGITPGHPSLYPEPGGQDR